MPKKRKVGKMAIFGQKPCVNAFGKCQFFGLFKLLVFILPKKKSWKNGHFCTKTIG